MIERTAVLANDRPPAAVEAHFIFDLRTGAITFLDAAATELFGVREAWTTQRLATDLVPELDDPTPRSFAADVSTAFGIRTLDLDVARLSGGDEEAILVVVRSARPAAAASAPRPTSLREERLESLWSLVVRRGVTGGDQVRTILREAIVGLGLDVAAVARIDGAELAVLFATREEDVGTRTPVARSPARSAIAGAGTYAVLDAQREPGALAGSAPTLRCSLTTAFRAGEERYVATFSSRAPRHEPFADADWRYAEDVTEALARAIERLASDERFERLAYSDALTSLPNRFALLAKLDAALEETDRVGGRTAVFFLDVDGFKGVNDTVGHRGGDAVLAEIAARLRSTLRREEYVGRLGGDEFAVIVPQVGETAELEKIAQRITSELTFPFQYDGYRFSLSASIGVAIYPDDARDRDTLLAIADDAMYAVKDGGARARDGVGSGVIALGKRPDEKPLEHEYVLFYQPILDVDRDEVASVEALVRRIDPEHGLLAPERGWTIARDVAGRRELDRFVLTAAARQARAWQRAGLPLRVDVNLAAYDTAALDALLGDETLANDVRRLRIEVDAASLARGDDALASFVAHGAANGLGFTLDGFDGALAMLPRLGELPIETVKLGRSIVDGALANPALLAVVQGTAIVARSLDWRVVAKGVESLEQQRALTALGCDAIQGYVVARPMAAAEITAWLRDRVPAERRA